MNVCCFTILFYALSLVCVVSMQVISADVPDTGQYWRVIRHLLRYAHVYMYGNILLCKNSMQ